MILGKLLAWFEALARAILLGGYPRTQPAPPPSDTRACTPDLET
jgi:hypothetical protein